MTSRQNSPTRRIAIAGGGSAGDSAVAWAIALEYRQAFPDADVLLLTPGDSHAPWPLRDKTTEPYMRRPLDAPQRLDHVSLAAAPFARQSAVRQLAAARTLLPAFVRARRLLRQRRTRLVVGAGAFASVAPLLAARQLGLDMVVHEANVEPGLATRLGAALGAAMTLGWDAAGGAFPRSRVVVAGNPVLPQAVPRIDAPARKRTPPWRHVLVLGGSEGSAFLNAQGPGLVARIGAIGPPVEVRHQTGRDVAPEPVLGSYRSLGVRATVVPWIEDIHEAYRWADFVVSAGGAITLAELAVEGVPSLIVPSSTVARDHQAANAACYAQRTGNFWSAESGWQPERLAAQIAAVLGNERELRERRAHGRVFGRPDAARAVVEFCEQLMKGRWGPGGARSSSRAV